MKKRGLIFGLVAGGSILLLAIAFFGNKKRPAAAGGDTNALIVSVRETLRPKAQASATRFSVRPIDAEPNDADGEPESLVSREQIEAYLVKARRSADSLLNVYEQTGDTSYLQEAATRFPTNKLVQLAVIMDDLQNTNLPPAQRKEWLDRLKAAAPQNALPSCLAAISDFKNGQAEAALAELREASGKRDAEPFYKERRQNLEEMFLMTGASPIDAKQWGMASLKMSPLESEMKSLAMYVGDLTQQYSAAGDQASFQEVLKLGLDVGQRWGNPNSAVIVSELVGIAMQRSLLKQLNPDTFYDFLGETAGQRTDELKKERAEIKPLVASLSSFYQQMSDNEKIVYLNRVQTFGERKTMAWLQQTYATNSANP